MKCYAHDIYEKLIDLYDYFQQLVDDLQYEKSDYDFDRLKAIQLDLKLYKDEFKKIGEEIKYYG